MIHNDYSMNKIRVLFICMGNICRSPSAEGVFRHLVDKMNLSTYFEIDSAGTHAYHVGEAPDFRAQAAARERGVEIKNQRARKVVFGDFEDFDYLLVMDDDNFEITHSACPDHYKHKVKYLLSYAPELCTLEVPDPYYGGAQGFERVLDMIDSASEGFLQFLRDERKLP
jgi:protein-tyrosine phosphatase